VLHDLPGISSTTHPIPPELKIYFGDNFIFDIALYNGKTNYIITNMKFTSPFATTTSDTSLVEGFLDKEHKLYMNIKSNFEMINNPIKTILIAIPTAKYIESETFKSIYDLIIPNGYKVQFQYFHGYNIAQIRNLIADWVIKGFDYLFAVDSDITFSNDTLVKLLSHNKDVVSGLYIQRLPNTHNLELYGPNGRINYEDITNKGLIEISSCGFGCVLVKKEVFVNIGYPQFEYYSAINHKDTISEDTDFCKKAINKGFLLAEGVYPIYAVIFVSGIARGFITPAIFSFMPQLVPRELFQNAISWNSTLWEMASIGGPPIGGLIYGVFGVTAAYAIDASLMITGLILAAMVASRPYPGLNAEILIQRILHAGSDR
jgi:hypothetical protein